MNSHTLIMDFLMNERLIDLLIDNSSSGREMTCRRSQGYLIHQLFNDSIN
jgi:hypothetical protein